MRFTFSTRGTPITVRKYDLGQLADGTGWAQVEADDDVLVDPHDRIDVLDDRTGDRLWTGIVRRVHHSGGAQTIDINDLTAVTMAHRITKTGEPDPHFRYGDFRYRYMALGADKVVTLDRREKIIFDIEVPSDWGIVE